MDLSKTYIQVPCYKQKISVQMTLDNDFNVPDAKPDIERLIQEKGSLNIHEMKAMKDKCMIRGELCFGILYIGDDGTGQLQSIDGAIPFEELVNMEGLEEHDALSLQWDMEDLRAGLINSRKVSVRSIVVLHLCATRTCNEEVAIAMENGQNLWAQNRTCHVNQCQIRQKDQIRIREEVMIPANRPNIMDIIWYRENLENLEIKLQDGAILIRGQLAIFLLYRDETLENAVNDVELNVPVDGKLDMPDVLQEMIPDVKIELDHLNLEVRNDKDGEARGIGVEAVFAVDICVYQEETLKLLQDVYSPKATYIPQRKEISLDNLILKNKSRCPVKERIQMHQEPARVLQICHAHARVKVDQMEIVNEGILVEGVAYLEILYISSDDRKPVNSTKTVLPFSYTIEADEISQGDSYDVVPGVEQLNVTMSDSDEIEVKMVISLDASIFKTVPIQVVCQVQEKPLDFEKIEEMPGVLGHVVMPEDSLWTIAKRYYASPEEIREINGISGDELPVGQPILIMKNMEILK